MTQPDELTRDETRAQTGAVPEGPDQGILAPYAGVVPPAPAWAQAALAVEPEQALLEVEGARVEVLAWGPRGAPGILLLHGNGAHAHWWSFLAPLIAAEGYRVAALSWSGMGGSDWRARYSMAVFRAEMLAAADWAGLFGAAAKPVIAAHSFGGFPAMAAVVADPAPWGRLVTLDSSVEPPDSEWQGPPRRATANRVYLDHTQALARFRLAPPQPCANHWALDWIARHSLKAVEGGFTWRFDPFLWENFERMSANDLAPRLPPDVWVVRGGRSILMQERTWSHMKVTFAPTTRFMTIPQARHHVMLDEPLAVASLLLAALAG
jgi:pimeloyl-ACP methyl ester carboxylesterase